MCTCDLERTLYLNKSYDFLGEYMARYTGNRNRIARRFGVNILAE
ncbi:unknown protein, partial [Waddlia chondrophila 2032/99]